MSLTNRIIGSYLKTRMLRINRFRLNPEEVQRFWFDKLIRVCRDTEFGRRHGFKSIRTWEQFSRRVPVNDYDSLKGDIGRMMMGEKNVLWPGKVEWYSKSSGTTSDKSKFIPVTGENLKKCHIRGPRDVLSLYYHNRPDAKIFDGRGVVMGGAWESFAPYPKSKIGDVSALMLHNMPPIAKYFHTPDVATAIMPEWEPKIERMAEIVSKANVTNIGGVPTWTIVLFRRILEITGKESIMDVWPNLEVYIHGGVSFAPYREQFREFLPDEKVAFMEIYNASEGFFAIQSDLETDDMLLLLDNGIYYEFLPPEEWHKEFPEAIPLEDVEIGKNYAIVVTTNSGLWRYVPGDTVKFTSKYPFKIKITGRTKHFINAFGEEVVVENSDKALSMTCQEMGASVKEYTVAPIYIEGESKGGHEWLIEFERPPADMEHFANRLDLNLQSINSDYEAKRYKSMALNRLVARAVPRGSFYRWMKSKGKYGGQNKVPRLANHRKYLDEILAFVE